jgi:hypothetical protein
VKRAVALMVVALAAGGCSHHGKNGTLLRLKAANLVFAHNGSRLAWIRSDRIVVVADLRSRKKRVLGAWPADAQTAVAVAGSTVVWSDVRGGNERVDAIRAASPHHYKRLASWFENDYYSGTGAVFGGVAADGSTLVYALYVLTGIDFASHGCVYEGICHYKVTGGGTFRVTPGSLAVRRIGPAARAVAVKGNTVAAAILRRGSPYNGRAQIVVENVTTGRRRPIGKPAVVQRLALDGNYIAALIGSDQAMRGICRIWNVKTGRLIGTIRGVDFFPLTLVGTRVLIRSLRGLVAVDARTGRRRLVRRGSYDVWVWGRRLVWLELHRAGRPDAYAFVRSAPLPTALS